MRTVLCPKCGGPGACEGYEGGEYTIRYCGPCESGYQLDRELEGITESCTYETENICKTIADIHGPVLSRRWFQYHAECEAFRA